MKIPFKSIVLLLAISFTFISCNSDDDSDSNNNQNSVDETIAIAQTGTWRITSFIDSGDDETSDFNGYVFTFNENGSLVADNGSVTVTGTWSVTDDSSSSGDDDSNTDDNDFNIFFPVPESNDFEDLNDDWDIVSVSSSVISLIDVSGGNGGTDTLVFEQN